MLKTNDSDRPSAPLTPEQKRARLAALLQAKAGAPAEASEAAMAAMMIFLNVSSMIGAAQRSTATDMTPSR